ncbi:MAG: glycosyltransferase [Candidatus Altiarchaeales archaeon]|nr:glycosyltransferase [Candidatus Altiarchaeales archaeon]MBD3415516.1 glycosyltransferase [Candidatus Altiarchaeales archaeon]
MKAKGKILLVTHRYLPADGDIPDAPRFRGGIPAYAGLFSRKLAETFKVDVFSYPGESGGESDSGGNPRVFHARKSSGWHGFRVLDKLIRSGDYDHICFQYTPQIYGWQGLTLALPLHLLYWRLTGFNYSFYLHEIALPFSPKYPLQMPFAVYNWLVYAVIGLCSSKVGVSTRSYERRSCKVLPFLRGKTFTIPVFSNFKRVEISGQRRKELMGEYGISEDEVVLVFMGTMHESKLFGHCVSALEKTLRSGVGAKLLCIGEETEKAAGHAGDPDVAGHMVSTGTIPASKVEELLSIGDIYLSPFIDGASTRRGSLMAGLNAGMPAATTTGVNLDDVFKGVPSISLTDPSDADGFAEAVAGLAGDRERIRELGRVSREFYDSHFTLEKVVGEHVRFFFTRNP